MEDISWGEEHLKNSFIGYFVSSPLLFFISKNRVSIMLKPTRSINILSLDVEFFDLLI